MLFLAIELQSLLENQKNNKLMGELIEAIESDLISPSFDMWRLDVLKKLKISGEKKLFERGREELSERFFDVGLLESIQ